MIELVGDVTVQNTEVSFVKQVDPTSAINQDQSTSGVTAFFIQSELQN